MKHRAGILLMICALSAGAAAEYEDNPFFPSSPAKPSAEASTERVPVRDAQWEIRQRLERGELRLMGQVNDKNVYYDTISREFVYLTDLSPVTSFQD